MSQVVAYEVRIATGDVTLHFICTRSDNYHLIIICDNLQAKRNMVNMILQQAVDGEQMRGGWQPYGTTAKRY